MCGHLGSRAAAILNPEIRELRSAKLTSNHIKISERVGGDACGSQDDGQEIPRSPETRYQASQF